MRRRVFRRLFHTDAVAEATAVGDILGDIADEVSQAVLLDDMKLHADTRRIAFQCVTPCRIFLVRVDIRIIPQRHRLDALGAERIDAVNGAGRTAAMHKNAIHLFHLGMFLFIVPQRLLHCKSAKKFTVSTRPLG